MLDASGKIPTEVLDFNTVWYGSYDECKRVQAVVNQNNKSEGEHVFNGQYCNALLPLPNPSPNMVSNAKSLIKKILQRMLNFQIL